MRRCAAPGLSCCPRRWPTSTAPSACSSCRPACTGQAPSPGGRFDLADPGQAATAYEAVLENARTLGDITGCLDARLLAALWPDIALGMRSATRAAWEAAFPVLASVPAAAA